MALYESSIADKNFTIAEFLEFFCGLHPYIYPIIELKTSFTKERRTLLCKVFQELFPMFQTRYRLNLYNNHTLAR